MAKFPKVGQDEIVYPKMDGYKMACCDCGLVHNWRFEIVRVLDENKPLSDDVVVDDPQLKVRLYCERNKRSTAAKRREDAKRETYRYRNLTEINLTLNGDENYKESVKTLVREMVKQGLLNSDTMDITLAFIEENINNEK